MKDLVVRRVKLDSINPQQVLIPVLHVTQEKLRHQPLQILKEIVVSAYVCVSHFRWLDRFLLLNESFVSF